jgi:hypothetical protein
MEDKMSITWRDKPIKFEAIFEDLEVAMVTDGKEIFDVQIDDIDNLPFSIEVIRECWYKEIVSSNNWVDFEEYVNHNILRIEDELFNIGMKREVTSRWDLGLQYC